MNTRLPGKVKIQTCYTGRRILSSKLKNKKERENDIVYHVNYPEESCEDSYIGEPGRRLEEWVKDHNGRDNKLHFLNQFIEKRHTNVE